MTYAGFWRRFVAYHIDAFIIGGVSFFLIGRFIGMEVDEDVFEAILVILGFPVGWVYYALFETLPTQATPGKLMLGMKVVNLKGNRIGFIRASVRFWGKLASILILMIGFIMIAGTEKKQGLHDKIAGCLVVMKKSY